MNYQPRTDDIAFLLFDVLDAPDRLRDLPGLADCDRDLFNQVLEGAARFAGDVVAPLNRDGDETGCRFDKGHVTTPPGFRDAYQQFRRDGWAGMSADPAYGGQGLPAEYERAFNQEARAYVMPDLGIAGGATLGVCGPTMVAHASPEFLQREVPRMLAGDAIVAQFFSDPDAGSDLAGVRTQAVRDGDRWILNGSKIWSSGAYYADYGMCLARTNWDVPKHRGLTWFLVPTDAPGVTVERIRQINGNSEFCQEFFSDVAHGDR